MKKWWILLVVFAAWVALGLVLLRGPHADAAQASEPLRTPNRIVSMAPNLTEILFSLGLDRSIVGVTLDSDYPAAARSKRAVGTFWQPDIETVIALKPDLTVTLGIPQQRDLASRLTQMGYRCLTLDLWTVDDFFKAIGAMGDATGCQAGAQALREQMQARIATIRNAWASRGKVRVLWVVQREPLRVAGRDTFVNELIELAGGENAIGPTTSRYPSVGGEQVLVSAPQVIIEPVETKSDLSMQRAQALSYWRRYASVPAVADGRIRVIDAAPVSRLGPRLCEGIEIVARCLHPEVFGE
jgi:iron complex transport system substrate-binding protein